MSIVSLVSTGVPVFRVTIFYLLEDRFRKVTYDMMRVPNIGEHLGYEGLRFRVTGVLQVMLPGHCSYEVSTERAP